MNEQQNTKTNQQTNTKNPNEIGACWVKISPKSNQEYLSIKLELDGQEYFLKGFLNGKFQNERQPKYLLFKSNPQNNNSEDNVVNDNRSNVEKRLTRLD